MMLVALKSFTPTNHFEVSEIIFSLGILVKSCFSFNQGAVYFLTKGEGGRSKPIMNKYIQMIYIDTWSCTFRLDFPKKMQMMMPGEQATVRLTLRTNMPIAEGQNFTLRENNVTVGTGMITKTFDPLILPSNVSLAKAPINVD